MELAPDREGVCLFYGARVDGLRARKAMILKVRCWKSSSKSTKTPSRTIRQSKRANIPSNKGQPRTFTI